VNRTAGSPAGTGQAAAPAGAARGAAAEQLAGEFLTRRGLQMLERNFRCTRGEIDLIMRHARELVFVEVRARSNPRFGDGAESVNRRKREKLQMAAAIYLQRNPAFAKMPCRFDVVSIAMRHAPPEIDWIPNAFG
jgi:putative endonuclease